MRITSKGQVTIPQAVRKALGLLPNTEVDFILEGNSSVRLVKTTKRSGRGKATIDALQGKADQSLSTDEIMTLTRGLK